MTMGGDLTFLGFHTSSFYITGRVGGGEGDGAIMTWEIWPHWIDRR